eukprot:CAMPEP_0181226386 /NCGR_PEP_ID=MMETSP1096-20121128/32232_1 /TAXON_ID=156174 ORGANISM="Chrysochromulina ericina, Strain CCMP281" /NCGR_SAMPLE_ID=MMETSP1096 /ASSEMBLY_ACC=CAM_ASM_000453 /LENGTH=174 /DNA_ID=CAMNT_0023319731 /DNA_START=42 /DNA_END=567 /DNA_ORIENTATION=-
MVVLVLCGLLPTQWLCCVTAAYPAAKLGVARGALWQLEAARARRLDSIKPAIKSTHAPTHAPSTPRPTPQATLKASATASWLLRGSWSARVPLSAQSFWVLVSSQSSRGWSSEAAESPQLPTRALPVGRLLAALLRVVDPPKVNIGWIPVQMDGRAVDESRSPRRGELLAAAFS